MLTKHLTILAILTILFVFLFIRLLGKTDSRHTITSLFIVVVILILFSLATAVKIDELSRGIVCPEYEKLENVYQRK